MAEAGRVPIDLDSLSVNGADMAIVAILLISAALAFFRGAVREVLAIAGWVAASAAAYYGFPYARPYVNQLIDMPVLADALTGVGLFVGAMVIMSLVNGAISRRVKMSNLDTLDRSLGFLFGLARGGLVICIAYLVMVIFVPPEEQPVTVYEARALPLVEIGAGWLVLAIPPEKHEEWAASIVAAKSFAAEALERKNALDILMSPPPVAESVDGTDYSGAERTDMDRLIESNQ